MGGFGGEGVARPRRAAELLMSAADPRSDALAEVDSSIPSLVAYEGADDLQVEVADVL
jgi:hypothetical protein